MHKEDLERRITQIQNSLQGLDIYSIILFGSCSQGNNSEESDIDLLVILDSDEIPESFEKRMEMKLSIRKSLRTINSQTPIDLLVYTKKEYELLQSEENAFLEEIKSTGKIIYEKAG